MQLEYDLSAGTLYIRLSDAEIARTREAGDNANVDLAQDGSVVGIEVIDIDLPWPLPEILHDYDIPPFEVAQLVRYFPLPAPTITVAPTAPVAVAMA